MVIINCKACGKECEAKRPTRKFCSSKCGQRHAGGRERRVMKCKWCGKPEVVYFKRGWDKKKFCSVKCREEYHSFNDKRSPFFKEDKTKADILKNKDLYVECQICGQFARRRLSTHIKTRHNISWADYKAKYPDAQNECQELRDHLYSLEFYLNRKDDKGVSAKRFKNGWGVIVKHCQKKVGYKCELCGYSKYQDALQGHHKLPIHFGGKNTVENCKILCANCHRHIHNKILAMTSANKIYTIEDIVRTCGKP